MSEAIIVSMIGSVGLIAVALINYRGNRTLGKRVEKVHDKAEILREQVQNSHSSNFRDDQDAFYAEVRGWMSSHDKRLDTISTQLQAQTERLTVHIDGGTD